MKWMVNNNFLFMTKKCHFVGKSLQNKMVLKCLLSIYCIMSQNGQTHFENLAAFAVRYLKCD